MTIKRHVSHIKSKQIKNGKPKLPEKDDLMYGEIAINYAENIETIAIKNSSDEIATFSSDTIRKKDEKVIADAVAELDEKKSDKGHTHQSNEIVSMSGYTIAESASPILSGDTLNEAIGKLEKGLDEKSGSAHTHVSKDIIKMEDYVKATSGSEITSGDSLNTAIGKLEFKADSAYFAVDKIAVSAEYDTEDKKIIFRNESDVTLSAMTIDATDFIVDGMIDKVELQEESGTTYLVITWNTDAGKETTKIDVGDIFEADNYFTKEELTGTTDYATVTKANSANTASTAITVALSGVTDADDLKAIEALPNDTGFLKKTEENTWVIDTTPYSSATEVNTALSKKSDTGHTHQSNEVVSMSGYTKAETASAIESGDTLNVAIGKLEKGLDDATVNIDDLSGQSETIATALVNLNANKVDAETFNTHSASTSHMNATEKSNLDSLADNIATISGITSTKVSDWDSATISSHTHSNKSVLDDITSSVGTMAYEDASSYSSATEVNEALNEKLNVSKFTKTTETISYALNELNSNMGGLKLMKISQADYDAIPVKDSFTLYVINE